TVRGDVHDIGKNLVDIILTNNGYRVVNLGIKQPIAAILDAAVEHRAHAIGMSGLLVKSTVVMRENLEEMSRQGLYLPVMLAGAAVLGRADYRPGAGKGDRALPQRAHALSIPVGLSEGRPLARRIQGVGARRAAPDPLPRPRDREPRGYPLAAGRLWLLALRRR